jgi:trans-aconitate methyltransferase
MSTSWKAYYDAVATQPPRDTLLKALALFDGGPLEHGFAIDLGCGSGIDTIELLRRGWRVLAIDREAEAIQRVRSAVPASGSADLETRVAAFEDLTTLPECNLVNASFSLPFCSPNHFGTLWAAITSALLPRGRIAGTLFGERDSWATNDDMTFHSREQIDAMLQGFKVEMLIEEERDGQTALGEAKHWHSFQIVARRV